jgi:hypothetical protein
MLPYSLQLLFYKELRATSGSGTTEDSVALFMKQKGSLMDMEGSLEENRGGPPEAHAGMWQKGESRVQLSLEGGWPKLWRIECEYERERQRRQEHLQR